MRRGVYYIKAPHTTYKRVVWGAFFIIYFYCLQARPWGPWGGGPIKLLPPIHIIYYVYGGLFLCPCFYFNAGYLTKGTIAVIKFYLRLL